MGGFDVNNQFNRLYLTQQAPQTNVIISSDQPFNISSPLSSIAGDGFTPLVSPSSSMDYSNDNTFYRNRRALAPTNQSLAIAQPPPHIHKHALRAPVRFPEYRPLSAQISYKSTHDWKKLTIDEHNQRKESAKMHARTDNQKENLEATANIVPIVPADFNQKKHIEKEKVEKNKFDWTRLQLTTEQTMQGYYCKPSTSEMQYRLLEDKHARVELVVGRRGHGHIRFHSVVLRHVVLSEVRIEPGNVRVYGVHNMVPMGWGLNVAAEVTLERIYPRKSEDVGDFYNYVEKVTRGIEGRLLCYDANRGVWQYEVQHFCV